METFKLLLLSGLCVAMGLAAQETFTVTGTSIPTELLKLNYGTMPKNIRALDLTICNVSDNKHPITSSAIFQALSQSEGNLHPIGRRVMLAAILRNQNRCLKSWLSMGLGTATSILSVFGRAESPTQARVYSITALSALLGQQLLTAWSPVLTADQVERFEAEALESALVLDGGSCVERTIFAVTDSVSFKAAAKQEPHRIEFHVR